MDEVTGRTVMEADKIVSIPLLSLPNLLVVPGQTLPMHVFNPQVTILQDLLCSLRSGQNRLGRTLRRLYTLSYISKS